MEEIELLDGSLGSVGTIFAATAALGTASFGLVDASKFFRGGISNVGYGFIEEALRPFRAALALIDSRDPYAVVKANWLNGVDKGEQKARARDLIRLGLTSSNAEALAADITGVDGPRLAAVALKVENGTPLVEEDTNLLGRFDAIVDARLDAAFERADQSYRNSARVAAGAVSVLLALIGAVLIVGMAAFEVGHFVTAVLLGAVATPIAPIAKDVASALSTAISAFKAAKR